MPWPEIVRRAADWAQRTAVVDDTGRYTYATLLHASESLADVLSASFEDAGRALSGARVVFLVSPGFSYVAWQWAIWRTGAVAVPLSSAQAPGEWAHIVDDVEPLVVVGPDEERLASMASRHGARYIAWPQHATGETPLLPSGIRHPAPGTQHVAPGTRHTAHRTSVSALDPALILYTSGTTSRPKGVVITHANLAAQMAMLTDAWAWRQEDRILHVLPLNHVHGIVNVLGCALWSGACCEFLSPFEPVGTWDRVSGGEVSVFMAVPTIYARLAAAYDAADADTRDRWAAGARGLRLMVSGSAALPVTLLERWREITGHVLLERYGMTEIGMALSNPLEGERRPGLVGRPLPGVDVRLVDEQGRAVAAGIAGELEVRGASVFREYWRRPDATREAFRDGWFRTGDVAAVEPGGYRILGRSSVDIIKTGGYKVSALEIEEVLRGHPGVAEVAVVGVADEEWGERVATAIVLRAGAAVALEALREWASPHLAKYKLPTRLAAVEALPRNAMGKVVKAEVRKLFTG